MSKQEKETSRLDITTISVEVMEPGRKEIFDRSLEWTVSKRQLYDVLPSQQLQKDAMTIALENRFNRDLRVANQPGLRNDEYDLLDRAITSACFPNYMLTDQ